MIPDRPVAARIHLPLKDKGESGEAFIALSGTLYQQNLIFSEPRELRWVNDSLELLVIFRDQTSFDDWLSNAAIQEYWSKKFDDLLVEIPFSAEETDVILAISLSF